MTQSNRILRHLEEGNSLTGIEALELFGSMKLATRISELKRDGNNIQKETVKENGKRFARYILVNYFFFALNRAKS